MKGYRKISEGGLKGWPEASEFENSYLDDQIRSVVHGPIIDVMQSEHPVSEFYVVVYKKVA